MKNKGLGAIAKKGRNGDTHLAHLQTGEMVVPPVISEETKARLLAEMEAAGIDPSEYMVGGEMSINPETGLPEFGFGKSISKAFKSVKKVVKKVTSNPIFSAALPFALGPAGLGLSTLASAGVGAGLGAISGNGLKGIAAGAIGAAAPGIGNSLGGQIAKTGLSGLASKSLGTALTSATAAKLGGADTKGALLSGGIGGLGSLYQSGAFNNLGRAFKEGGLSNTLSEFGSNISGTGDILQATSGTAPSAAGGGTSSFTPETINWNQGGSTTLPPETITWNTPKPDNLFDRVVNSTGEDMASNRGLNSLASAGIDTYANNKAADQLLKYQKQGLAALKPYLNQTWTGADLQNDPGYQFQLDQGLKGIDRASAARGNFYSGDALRSAGEYAQGLADTTANSAYQRWLGQQQQGMQGVAAQYGIFGDMGNTKATNTINNANSWTDSIANYLQPDDSLESLLAKYRSRSAYA